MLFLISRLVLAPTTAGLALAESDRIGPHRVRARIQSARIDLVARDLRLASDDEKCISLAPIDCATGRLAKPGARLLAPSWRDQVAAGQSV